MKPSIVATTAAPLLAALATAAMPQHGGQHAPSAGGWGAQDGPFAAFPSCVSSCRDQAGDGSDSQSLCHDASSAPGTLSACVDGSSCSDADKDAVKRAVAQLCANAGATITAAPFASYSVTSGGSAWPTAWTTNSAWASAVSAWDRANATGVGRPGWRGPGEAGVGPFGHGPSGGNGWGTGSWASSGAWTSGAWTHWWGTNACPASTWSGWTDGPFSTSAPWTTWSACTAQTTATATVTLTTTDASGSSLTSISTSFGIRVAEATGDSNATAVSTASVDSGAMPTNQVVLGAAAGVVGVLAGALFL